MLETNGKTEDERKKKKKKKKKKSFEQLLFEDCPNGCGEEKEDEDQNNGYCSDGDEMDANAIERLFRACERVCSSSTSANVTTASTTTSFAARRQTQRERTREIYERLKPHLERVTAREVGLLRWREDFVETEEEEDTTSGDDTEEEEEFARDPLKSLFASMFKRAKKKKMKMKKSSSVSAQAFNFLLGGSKEGGKPPAVYSQRIYGGEDFQICTFIIPKGMEIPLHNHPEMTVLSKCLYGSARVQKYKWADGKYEDTTACKPRGCHLVSDDVIVASGGGIQVCSPEENIHRIVAITDVAILDVFVPPYDVNGDRDCTYYDLDGTENEEAETEIETEEELEITEITPESLFTLVEIEDSPFECLAMEYRGLKISSGNK